MPCLRVYSSPAIVAMLNLITGGRIGMIGHGLRTEGRRHICSIEWFFGVLWKIGLQTQAAERAGRRREEKLMPPAGLRSKRSEAQIRVNEHPFVPLFGYNPPLRPPVATKGLVS